MKQSIFYIIFIFFSSSVLLSQGAIDGYMKGKGNTDFALSYSYESYSEYFFGKQLENRENSNHTASLFIEHAFQDYLDLVVSVPYIYTDEMNSGLQDAILAIKFRNKKRDLKNGSLSTITATGLSFPLSNYPIDTEQPIGIRATTFQLRLLMQYQSYSGFFAMIQTGYDLRIAPSLQNAVPVIFRAGFGASKFYVDAYLDFFNTFNAGVDNTIFAGEGSVWWKIGGTFYYPFSPKFGLFVGASRYLTGQNIGLGTRVNVGVVYKKMGKKK